MDSAMLRAAPGMRPNHLRWLQAALDTGVQAEAFVIIEWELGEPSVTCSTRPAQTL
jgi:hypothetical protein